MRKKIINKDKPEGAEIKYCSRWFKFGVHGKLFVWRQYQWEVSTLEHSLVKAAMRKREFDLNRDRSAERRIRV